MAAFSPSTAAVTGNAATALIADTMAAAKSAVSAMAEAAIRTRVPSMYMLTVPACVAAVAKVMLPAAATPAGSSASAPHQTSGQVLLVRPVFIMLCNWLPSP